MKKYLLPAAAAFFMAVSCASPEDAGNQADSAPAAGEVTADDVANPATADQPAVDPATLPVMTFPEDRFNFGSVNQGEKVEHTFVFTNTGKSSLVISNAKGSCGCTVPQYPKEPIAPGAEAKIDVRFDSSNKKGKQHKTVTITHNGEPNKTILHIEGEVIAPENPAE